MELSLIFDGSATVEDLLVLHGLGYEFTINNGQITCVEHDGKVVG